MKPLILILLAATFAAAQTPTIADIARQERARRAPSTGSKVYTTADIKKTAPETADAQPIMGTVATSTPATPATSAPVREPAAATLEKDPVQDWLADTEKLRVEIRGLMDKEAVSQLAIYDVVNKSNAAVTTVADRDRALADLGVAQKSLAELRDQISKKRSELQARELQGPPKKQP